MLEVDSGDDDADRFYKDYVFFSVNKSIAHKKGRDGEIERG